MRRLNSRIDHYRGSIGQEGKQIDPMFRGKEMQAQGERLTKLSDKCSRVADRIGAAIQSALEQDMKVEVRIWGNSAKVKCTAVDEESGEKTWGGSEVRGS